MKRVRFLVAWLAAGLSPACTGEEHPSRLATEPEPRPDAGVVLIDVGSGRPPALDAGGYCGNELIRTRETSTNIYFVVDRSASMDERMEGSAFDKLTSTHVAIIELIRDIGHRVSYGAAAFPSREGGCSAGEEVFSTRRGDPVSYATAGVDGPVLKLFSSVLLSLSPDGGTPSASTLSAITPSLLALEGETTVIFATDGQPNCNPEARCGLEDCYFAFLARRGDVLTVDGVVCDEQTNCCDPSIFDGGPLQCVDADATVLAVTRLAQAGIKTFVVGMPGSEYFADVLDRVALAGGAGRPTSPHYYPVESASELGDVIRRIGTSVALSCDVQLAAAPPDRGLVNVYFDSGLLPYDEENGWAWAGSSSLRIRGAPCDSLMAGDILQVQVVSGCPTEVR